jgi:hypothetical protein
MAFGPVDERLNFVSRHNNLMHYAFIIRIQSLNLIPFKEESQFKKSSCNYGMSVRDIHKKPRI